MSATTICSRGATDGEPSGPHDRDGLHGSGHPDAVARQHHCQCRAALHAGHDVGEPGRDQLGIDELHRRGGDHDGAHRVPGLAVWPHAVVRDRRHRLHRSLRAVRPGGITRPDRCVPHPARHVRRGPRATVAVGDVRTLPARATCQGDGPVDHGRDDGPDLRSHPGRMAYRQLQLALGVLHQRAVRHRDRDRPGDVPEGELVRQVGETRLDRLRCVEPGDRLVPDDARPRRDTGLVQLA